MGRDSHLFIPPTAGQDDFCTVFAALLGGVAERRYFNEAHTNGYSVECPGLEARSTNVTTEYNTIEGRVGDHQVYSHWHWCHGGHYGFPGYHLISCSYSEHRLPLLRALADFFGGYVDYDDCDSTVLDYIAESNNIPYSLDASDGAAWYGLQEAMLAVEPIDLPRPWHDFS